MPTKYDICIIGAGPAGLMAAINAAKNSASTLVIESNAIAGKKLLRTGGGHCNITHLAPPAQILKDFGKYERFLRHAIYELSPQQFVDYLDSLGVPTRLEKNNGVWPISDKASDVRDALLRGAADAGVNFLYGQTVTKVTRENDLYVSDCTEGRIESSSLIIATGGASWPDTGSRGDGFQFAKDLGHTIITPRPALVPLTTKQTWPSRLAGISLTDISLAAIIAGKKTSVTGDTLFTHSGIGGPAPFDLSRLIIDDLAAGHAVDISVDFLTEIKSDTLEKDIDSFCTAHPRQNLFTLTSRLVPRALAETICRLISVDQTIQLAQLSRPARKQLVAALKSTKLTITTTRPLAEATVTHGGVSTIEINDKTMESKICPGLFFAGEVIDVDGPCGGYNLQIAFSTGALAGKSAALK